MPLQWTIDHQRHRVDAIVDGELAADDLHTYLKEITEAGAMPYAKLFDVSKMKGALPFDELRGAGASVRQHTIEGRGRIGPLAILVADGYTHFQAAQFADAAGRSRPLQIFQDRREAERWLERNSVQTKAESYRQY